eukprot:jgi/Phyca11/561644/estExt2_Genewise1.C_PHYCAscaffold_70574
MSLRPVPSSSSAFEVLMQSSTPVDMLQFDLNQVITMDTRESVVSQAFRQLYRSNPRREEAI